MPENQLFDAHYTDYASVGVSRNQRKYVDVSTLAIVEPDQTPMCVTRNSTQSLTLNHVLSDVFAKEADSRFIVCDSYQFRAIVYLKSRDLTALAKGMLLVDAQLEDRATRLQESCLKVTAKGKFDLRYSLDLIAKTNKSQHTPEITPSLFSFLKLRICHISARERRQQLTKKLDAFMHKAKEKTRKHLVHKSFGLVWHAPCDQDRFSPVNIRLTSDNGHATPMKDLRCNRMAQTIPPP